MIFIVGKSGHIEVGISHGMCKKDIHYDLKWQVEATPNILKNAVEYSNHGG